MEHGNLRMSWIRRSKIRLRTGRVRNQLLGADNRNRYGGGAIKFVHGVFDLSIGMHG